MNKQEFLAQLRKGLSGLPQEEMEERLTFYGEMIEDRMEEGLTEAEAVEAVGAVEEIVTQVVAEIPLTKLAREKIKPGRRLKAWEIALLVVGSPLWISLGAAVLVAGLAVYLSLWTVIICLWAVFVALVCCALAGALAGLVFAVSGDGTAGLTMLAVCLVCAGFAVFAFYGSKAVTKGFLKLSGRAAAGLKRRLVGKENV